MGKASDRLCDYLDRADQGEGPIVVAVGVHGPTSAMIAATTGYEVVGNSRPWIVHISGFGVAAARFLLPDTGQIGWDEYFLEIQNIVNNVFYRYPDVLMTADLDHGYGKPTVAAEHISQVIKLGIAGFNLEDQQYDWEPGEDIHNKLSELYGIESAEHFAKEKTNPGFHWHKSCGHIGSDSVVIPGRLGGGKVVLPLEYMVKKIQTVAKLRDELAPRYGHVAMNARTDIFSTYPMDKGRDAIEDAIERGNAYLEAGADCIYYEAVPPFEGIDEISTVRRLVEATDGPTTFNALRGGRTKERFSIQQLEDLGAARVHLPTLSYQIYSQAMMEAFCIMWRTMDDSHIDTLDFTATADIVGWPDFLGKLLASPHMLHEIVKQGGREEALRIIDDIRDKFYVRDQDVSGDDG